MELTCPKCHGVMRTYERNGVHVDQCAECRGIFLDRGELDRLIDAENAWHGGAAAAAPPAPERRDDDDRHYAQASPKQGSGDLGAVVGEVLRQVRGSKSGSYGHQQQHGHRRKKESFLGDLFG
jgi:Zn-finger nucleic acid-binding protein